MRTLAVICAMVWAAAAFAADTMVSGAGAAADSGPGPSADGARELRWDNGTREYFVCWYTGQDSWAGNDFSGSVAWPPGRGTDCGAIRVVSVRVYTSNKWPNDRWDGFRVAIYDFVGGAYPEPGERLWPESGAGRFFKPAGPKGEYWVEVPVDWTTANVSFVAAMEQIYDQPRCDPFAVDSNRTFLRHSWSYYSGLWARLKVMSDPYFNLMLRVVVEDRAYVPAVAPTSFGRVKALYR
jgi:hypothetical protein